MGCEAETDVSALMLLWRLLILQPSMLRIWCEVLLGGTFQDLSFVGAYNYPDQWITWMLVLDPIVMPNLETH
jgi:hypothetical protein